MSASHPAEHEGKVAVVLGSSRRMGRAIAKRFGQSGASVVVVARGVRGNVAEVAAEIESAGSRSAAIAADVSKPADVEKLLGEVIGRFGRIDVLVNTIAQRKHAPLAETSLDDWHQVLASVLDTTFLAAKAFAPHLKNSRGTIVTIGGASAHFGQKHHAAVMTAKLGLIGLTRALAIDLAPEVTVNCLIPGRIEAPEDTRHASTRYPMERILAGRPGTLEEVSEAVLMLCNPRCRFITGQAIHISGGMLFGL